MKKKLMFESALVCAGTIAAAAMVAFGEPARADLMIAGAATTVVAMDDYDMSLLPLEPVDAGVQR